ncbi:MAG TPA: acyltransferase [Candidatus Baltobacteraceae bacterium]|nr:acyltransferase [Candidatus Baltobacteraceae bacterium]
MDVKRPPELRMAYVDGLRAVAVLLVIMHHVMLHSTILPHPVPFAGLAHFMLEGAHGVDVFFVLSGFCLSYPLLQRVRRNGETTFEVCRYFSKRIVRIVPPYYAALALFLIVVPGGGAPLEVLKQMLFLDWHTHFVNGSFWTLCVEFRWYIVFPAILILWVRAPKVFTALALFTVLAYGFTRLHAPDIGTLLPFMLGIVAADIEIRHLRIDPLLWAVLPVAILCGAVLEQSASMPSPQGAESSIFFVQTNAGWQIAAFMLVLAGGRLQILRRMLCLRPLVAIGTASYSIYLVHEPVVGWIDQHARLAPAATMALAYSAALLAGFMFWAAVERWWTSTPLKERAISVVQPRVDAAAGMLEIPRKVALCVAEREISEGA